MKGCTLVVLSLPLRARSLSALAPGHPAYGGSITFSDASERDTAPSSQQRHAPVLLCARVPSASPSRAVACSLDAVNRHSTDTLLHPHHPRPQPNLSAADAAPCSEGWPAPASLNGWVICPWSVLCAAKPVQKLTRPFCMSSLGMVRLSATEITARRLRPS